MHREVDWNTYIEEGLAALPETFRLRIENVAILLEDEPSDEVRREEGLAPGETLLGYYRGIPLPLRGESYGIGATVPDTITLYRLPILDEAQYDVEQVRVVVRDTIWHEFGHYFGLEEDEVRRREHMRATQAPHQ